MGLRERRPDPGQECVPAAAATGPARGRGHLGQLLPDAGRRVPERQRVRLVLGAIRRAGAGGDGGPRGEAVRAGPADDLDGPRQPVRPPPVGPAAAAGGRLPGVLGPAGDHGLSVPLPGGRAGAVDGVLVA